jgi:alpha-amylase
VGGDGKANIKINNYEEPILAVCTDCSSGGGSVGTPGSTLPTTPLPTLGPGAKRTVIFIQKQTNPGQDLFVRGGIDGTRRPPCTDINSDCSIAFQVSNNN